MAWVGAGQPGKWGDGCLGQWLEMYQTNVTLLKIVWRTDSKKTVTLTSFLARNTDINRALEKDGDYVKLLPDVRAVPTHNTTHTTHNT